jgi:hypothetical protein
MSSEFLVIIPPGWIQLDWVYITNNIPGMAENNVIGGLLSDVEYALKNAGIIPEDKSLVEFKLIDGTYFLVKLG